MLDAAVAVLSTGFLGLGLLLATIGLYGLLRQREIFVQLHAAGLISGPASLLVLITSLATGRAEIITSALLIAAFVLVTAPLSSHAVGRAALRRSQAPDEPDDPVPEQPDHDGVSSR